MRPIPIVMISIQARKLVKVSIIMIATRSIKIENVTVEQNTVAATMFGANTLQSVNTSDSGVPFAQYETAITVAGVSDMGVITFAPAIDLALQNHQINEENDVYYRCKMVRRVIKTS